MLGIDKTSSAELTEAINSMFRWYKHSAVCYAFLADLEPSKTTKEKDLEQCRWFTRGWTLQELIAPHTMAFFDKEWKFRGTKRKLKTVLSSITGIPKEVLEDVEEVFGQCIAKRMSWAANRQTTRQEDMAYCLLGLFNVYMPMIYGEGTAAFTRLQEELIKGNRDRSIFAWKVSATRDERKKQPYRGILAHSPSEFAHCGKYGRLQVAYRSNSDFVMTNRGIRFEGRLPLSFEGKAGYLLDLECCDFVTPEKMSWIGILMDKTGRNGYVRSDPHNMRYFDRFLDDQWYPPYLTLNRFFVAKDLYQRDVRDISRQYALCIKFKLPSNLHIVSVQPEELWDPIQSLFWTLGADTFIGAVWVRSDSGILSLLVCGTKRPHHTDMVPAETPEPGGDQAEKTKSPSPRRSLMRVLPDNIKGRIPWCYTYANGEAIHDERRMYSNTASGVSGPYEVNLPMLWRNIENPKPARHKSRWVPPGAGSHSRVELEAFTSLVEYLEQDAFLVDVRVSGNGAGPSEAGSGETQVGALLKPVPYRHVPSRSPSRSPTGKKSVKRSSGGGSTRQWRGSEATEL